MKLPNGYGSVTKLSGNRRKPYLARVTLGWVINEETGKAVQNRVPIGTFKTKKDALQALAEYGANPYDIQNNNMTLAELYERWTATYFPTLESDSSSRTIIAAWRYCHAILFQNRMIIRHFRCGISGYQKSMTAILQIG